MTSTVKKWVEGKGYGFIGNPDGGRDVFVHVKSFANRSLQHLLPGQKVEFEVEETPKGLQAVNVRLVL